MGKFETVYFVCGQIRDRFGLLFSLVGKLETDYFIGGQFRDRFVLFLAWWANSRPFIWLVGKFETVFICFETGGQIQDRFERRSRIPPPVGKFETVFTDGLEFPHPVKTL